MNPLREAEIDRSREGMPVPSRLCRLAVSVLLVAHFAALFTAVTGAQSGRFAPPALCAEANQIAAPYLNALYLDSSYRFFAPNPWADDTLWIRAGFERGPDRWLQWPDPDEPKWTVPYKRNLGLTQISDHFLVDADDPASLRLAPAGRVCLASYARRAGRLVSRPGDRVERIEFFLMSHQPPTITQVRAGWTFADLRLYGCTLIGRFTPDGEPQSDEVRAIPVANLAVLVLQDSLRPHLRHTPGEGLPRNLGTPVPVVRLVERHPELLTISRDALPSAVRAAVIGDDDPLWAGELQPGVDYAEDWIRVP